MAFPMPIRVMLCSAWVIVVVASVTGSLTL